MITLFKAPNKPDAKIFRFPRWIGMAVLYITYCLVGIFEFRSQLMGVPFGFTTVLLGLVKSENMGLVMNGSLYLLAGLIPYIVFEVFAWLFATFMRMRFQNFNSAHMRHIIRCFFIVRNLILAPLYSVLFLYPLAIAWMMHILTFLVTTAAVLGFFFYYTSVTVPHFIQGYVLQFMGQTYLAYQLIAFLFAVLPGVM